MNFQMITASLPLHIHTVLYPCHPKILVKLRYIIRNGVFRMIHVNFGLKKPLEVI